MSYLSHGAGDTYVTYSTQTLQIRHLEGVVGVEVGVGDEGFKETGIDIVVVIGKLLPQNALPCWLEKCGQDLVARACNVCVCVCVCARARAHVLTQTQPGSPAYIEQDQNKPEYREWLRDAPQTGHEVSAGRNQVPSQGQKRCCRTKPLRNPAPERGECRSPLTPAAVSLTAGRGPPSPDPCTSCQPCREAWAQTSIFATSVPRARRCRSARSRPAATRASGLASPALPCAGPLSVAVATQPGPAASSPFLASKRSLADPHRLPPDSNHTCRRHETSEAPAR